MRILAFSVLVATSLALLCPAYAEGTDTGLGFEAARLRGLHYKKVPSRKLSQEKASEYVLRLLDEELKPGPTLTKEVFLKELKLMPRKTTIKKILSKLYASQVRGIYDPAKKIFLVVDGVSDQSASAIAASMAGMDASEIYTVHELEHAIQDQHFDLSAISKRVEANSDQAFAAQSLIEGDATLVMMKYTMEKIGVGEGAIDLSNPGMLSYSQSDLKELGLEGYFDEATGLTSLTDPVLNCAPLYFQEWLSVPYNRGMIFVETVRKRGGWAAVNKAFKQLPASSEQIYHPEKYLGAKDKPKAVQVGKIPPQLGKFKFVGRDTAGEFTVRILARQYDKDLAGAEGWGGDTYLSYSDGVQGFSVWYTVWDTQRDAEEFKVLIDSVLKLCGRNRKTTYAAVRQEDRVKVYLGVPPEFKSRF